MASAIGSPALVAGNAATAQWTRPDQPRQLGKISQAGAVSRVSIAASPRDGRKGLCAKSRTGRSSRKSSCMVRADFGSHETSRPGVGETVSLRDVASESEGGVGDSAALRDISSEAAAEGGQTPEVHKTAKDKAEHSPLHESVEDIEGKAEEVSSAVAQDAADGSVEVGNGRSEVGEKREGDRPVAFRDVELPVELPEKDRRGVSSDKTEHSNLQETVKDVEGAAEGVSSTERSGKVSNGRSGHGGQERQGAYPPGFNDVDLPEKTSPGEHASSTESRGRDTGLETKSTSGAQPVDDEPELPTVQEIGAEIVETIKDGIEQLKWSAESVITSGGYARKGLETAKEAIDKRLRGLSVAADEVRELGAQAAVMAQKGWGGFSEKAEVIQKEVASLTEELQSSSDDLSKRASDGSEKSRSQILQALRQAEERARTVGSQVTEAARQLGEEANERGTKLGETAEKALHDIQEQARQVGDAVGEAAQDVQNRGSRVSESSGKIIKEAENLTKELGKGGESGPNSEENFAERLQNQGNKVSTSTGNVIRESEDLWRDLLKSDTHKNSDQQPEESSSRTDVSRNDDDAAAAMKNEYEDEQPANLSASGTNDV